MTPPPSTSDKDFRASQFGHVSQGSTPFYMNNEEMEPDFVFGPTHVESESPSPSRTSSHFEIEYEPPSPASVIRRDPAIQAEKSSTLVTDAVFLSEERQVRLASLKSQMLSQMPQGLSAKDQQIYVQEVERKFAKGEADMATVVRLGLLVSTTSENGTPSARVSSEVNGAGLAGHPPEIPPATLLLAGQRRTFYMPPETGTQAKDPNGGLQEIVNYLFGGKLGSTTPPPSLPSPELVAAGTKPFELPEDIASVRMYSTHHTTLQQMPDGQVNITELDVSKISALTSPLEKFDKGVDKCKRHICACPFVGMTAAEVALHKTGSAKIPIDLKTGEPTVPASAVYGPDGLLYHTEGPRAGTPVDIHGDFPAWGEVYIEIHPAKRGSNEVPSITIGLETVPPEGGGKSYTNQEGTKSHNKGSNREKSAKSDGYGGGAKLSEQALEPQHVVNAVGGCLVGVTRHALATARGAEQALARDALLPDKRTDAAHNLHDLFTLPTHSADSAMPTAIKHLADLAASTQPVQPASPRTSKHAWV